MDELIEKLREERERIKNEIEKKIEQFQISKYNLDELDDFLKEPYVIIPKREKEFYVIAPKWVNFQIGWLERSTRSYNIFVVNKYMQWLAQIPEGLKERLKFPEPLPLKVYDGMLLTGKEYQERAWEKYKHFLSMRVGKERIRIRRGYEFKLIAQLIEDGILPFIPRSVEEEDLREWNGIKLRTYQERAWKEFLDKGAVGIFWAFAAGKSLFGLYALGRIKGKKLVVVPTLTLKEQWEERIREYIPEYAHEIEIVTYHAYHKVKNKEYSLIVFDECHRLPANTYIRLATIRTKYRIGLSGSPFREDKRENYIFALTGFPIGLSWDELLKLKVIRKPTFKLYILSDNRAKIRKLDELLQRIAKTFNVPFVYGATKDRLEVIRNSDIAVVSRVGDEGLSFPELERVIEVAFLRGCYDEKTEVLTKDGFKPFKNITFKDKLATLNKDGFIEYHKPTKIISFYHEGRMINFVGKNYNLLVTPDNDMYVRANFYRKKVKNPKFKFKKASELMKLSPSSLSHYEFKRDVRWKGIDRKVVVFKRSTKDPYNKDDIRIPINTFLKFLGWYISDGSTGKRGIIKISDPKEESKRELVGIFKEMGLNPKVTPDGVYVYSRPISRFLQKLGKAHTKYIPKWVKNLPSHRLKLLFETLMKGDGDKLKTRYTTVSKQLADDFQEICLKIGLACTIYSRKPKKVKFKDGHITKSKGSYDIIISRKQLTPEIETIPKEVEYAGFVYDVTVPNHTIYVRRCGKAVWSGNSRMQESQRFGRLMHSGKEEPEHIILMTQDEFERYQKRLYAITERGFHLEIMR